MDVHGSHFEANRHCVGTNYLLLFFCKNAVHVRNKWKNLFCHCFMKYVKKGHFRVEIWWDKDKEVARYEIKPG